MKIIIHRGTHQIGGCSTEISTEKARILIDFGAELDRETALPLKIDGVSFGKSNCDGIFFTHYHGDHVGLIDSINSDIPLYIGDFAKHILMLLNERINSFDNNRINKMITFSAGKSILIKDIKITPFWVDHSAYDAYMFLIEADGKKILHTGDFRTHGFRGKGFESTLRKYIGHVDLLICEGTLLSRTGYKIKTEHSLNLEIRELLEKEKYVFVICSSTNIDRLASFCSAVPKGKYCVCDYYQKKVTEAAKSYASKYSSLYDFPKLLIYGENLDEKMLKQGFCMFIRLGNKYHKEIMDKFRKLNPLIAYSMWDGYLNEKETSDFVSGYRLEYFHTSGHADEKSIKMLIDITSPPKIIPIHTEEPKEFNRISYNENVCTVSDGEIITI